MGPQLDSCGRTDREIVDLRVLSLQWGRNLTVAEGSLGIRKWRPVDVLQWGRNLTVAEGRLRRRLPRAGTESFNGAAT